MSLTLTNDYQLISTISLTYGELRTYAKYNSQDKTANTTTYKAKSIYYIPTQYYVAFDRATASLLGESKSYGYTTFYKGESLVQEVTKTVKHNEDGSSPSISVSTSWSATFGGSGSTSVSIEMPKIDTLPVIKNATQFNDEQNPIIEFTNPANLIIKPSLWFYKYSDVTTPVHVIERDTNISSPYTWNITNDERTALRNKLNDAKEYLVRISLRTYDKNGEYIDSVWSEKNFIIVNAEPTFTTAFTENNSKVISLLGTDASKIIKDVSNVKVLVTPSAKKGATIKTVEIIHGTSDVIRNASPYETTLTAISNSYKIVVSDSRGYVVSSTIPKTLIDYLPIEISQYSFKRVSPTSSDIKLNATIVYKQQTFNTTSNVPTIKWKKGSDGTWNTISSSNYSLDKTNNKITISDLLLSGILPYTQSAKFYLSVSDLLTSDDENVTVTVGIPVFDYGEEDFQVNGTFKLADRSRNVYGTINKSSFNYQGNMNIKADGTNISYQQGGVPILRYNGTDTTVVSSSKTILFRPNGTTNGTKEVKIDTNGDITTPKGTVATTNDVNAVVTSGSNSNGSYIKYSDGTLICRGKGTFSPANGNTGVSTTKTFPLSFVDTDYDVTVTIYDGGAYWSWLAKQVGGKTKTSMTVYAWNNTSYKTETAYFSYIAIGRWK